MGSPTATIRDAVRADRRRRAPGAWSTLPALIALLCMAPVSVADGRTQAADRAGVRDWSLTLLQVVRGLMAPESADSDRAARPEAGKADHRGVLPRSESTRVGWIATDGARCGLLDLPPPMGR